LKIKLAEHIEELRKRAYIRIQRDTAGSADQYLWDYELYLGCVEADRNLFDKGKHRGN